jgi:putative Mg2+ transporter-C (MgtC) family protein
MFQDMFVGLGDAAHLGRVAVRLVVACIAGGLVGFERQVERKTGGLRTHMLVALGAALFVLIAVEMKTDVSRVIQGVAAGVGFLGAGMIFRLTDQQEVKGLTSAASVWVTASIGMAVGVGFIWPALVTVVLGWLILYTLHHCERWLKHALKGSSSKSKPDNNQEDSDCTS